MAVINKHKNGRGLYIAKENVGDPYGGAPYQWWSSIEGHNADSQFPIVLDEARKIFRAGVYGPIGFDENANVKYGERPVLINDEGLQIYDLTYSELAELHNNIAIVKTSNVFLRNTGYECIDKNGRIISKKANLEDFDWERSFDSIEKVMSPDNLAFVTKGNKVAVVNVERKTVVLGAHDDIKHAFGEYLDGYFILTKNGKKALYSINDKTILCGYEYDSIEMRQGFAAVEQDGKFGIYWVSKKKWLIDVVCESAQEAFGAVDGAIDDLYRHGEGVNV